MRAAGFRVGPARAIARTAFLVSALALLLALESARPQPREVARAAVPPDIALALVTSGLGPVTSVTNVGDGRLFLTIQTGQILIVRPGAPPPEVFLDIAPLISCCGERGLLSVAFHPRFSSTGFFFVYYTNTAGDIQVARFRVSADPDRADAASGVSLLTVPHPFNANHNGGQLQFGHDGLLYIGTGDGGSANDPPCNAQNDGVLLGKLLRIDVDGNAGSPPFYGIPPSNPFAAPGGPREEIWAKGLRNPWRFSFDRLTGDLWIGDVGQGNREEIDFQPLASPGGENYGWKVMEGTACGGAGGSGCLPGVPACLAPDFVLPVFEYTHVSDNCSVTGGYVYRGGRVPQLAGRYLYGDFCSGRLWANGELLAPILPNLTTFGEDSVGELYAATSSGTLFQFVGNGPPPPTPGRTVVPPALRRLTPRVLVRPS